MAEDNSSADITGLQAQPIPGWEKRVRELCKPTEFPVSLNVSATIWDALSITERQRLFRKLRLVEQAAQWMAAGMLKGTLKYESDDYPLEQWFAHLLGEGADQMNYQLLLYQAFLSQKGEK